MRNKLGFTLIELLIVVAIIAILAAIAVPNFLEAQVRSKASRAKADLRTSITALEAYAIDHNKYPVPRFEAPVNLDGSPATSANSSCAMFLPGGFHPYNPPAGMDLVGGVTSPIAYMTSTMQDPFITGVYTERHRDLGYQNIHLWNSPGNLGTREFGQPATLGPVPLQRYGAYIVRSVGPDRVYTSVIAPYDSTNGTVSRGDIYRTQKREKNASSIGGE